MTGFDLSDTRDYYRSIVHRAVNEAKAIGDIEQRAKTIDRDLEWVLMGDDIGDVFEFGDFSYSPSWGPSRGGSSQGSGSSAPGGRTTIGDVGASFAGWAENTMGNVADALAPGSLQLSDAHSGVIDLSGVDGVTADILASLAEGASSSGGGSCACAGCACACACAGGGR